MPQLRKALGVDIGSTSVKIAEVVSDKTGVRVTKIVQGDLGLPAGPMDAEHLAAISRVVRDLLKENKITTKSAVFAIPGQSVFIRRIKVPRTTEERLHLIVSYEAKQQIPFALDNALMEYQVFDAEDSPELEVLLVAIKRDLVTDFMKVVERTGLKPLMVSVSSLALFNFQVFDATPYEDFVSTVSSRKRKAKPLAEAAVAAEDGAPPSAKKKGFSLDLSKLGGMFSKKKKAAADEPQMVTEADVLPDYDDASSAFFEEVKAYVNIGASTFDLAIGRLGKQNMLGFTRSVPWAGNELTRSLMEKMGLASSSEAEEMKKGRSGVVIPGREDDIQHLGLDPDASEFATTWADRLILDLRKSFDYYISQPDGMAVDSIVLSGGQSLERNLSAYIEEKLGIPVEVKTEVQNAALKVPPLPDPEGVTPYLIAMGLGLSGIGLGRVTVDFLPSEQKTLREFKKKNIPVVMLLVTMGAMIVTGTQVGKNSAERMEAWLTSQDAKLRQVTQDGQKLKQAEENRKTVDTKLNALGDSISDRAFWMEFLGVIESAKPPDVLITGINMNPDGSVVLKCETEAVGRIAQFNQALESKKDWIKSYNLIRPVPVLSQFIGREVQSFMLRLEVYWKDTRLAPARQTLLPGVTAPTPTPTPAAVPGGMMPGMMPGMPGNPPGAGGMPVMI